MRRFVVVLCWLGFTPFAAFALGLGDIELESALNQPFSAQIPLESYEEDDLKSLQVGLASADTFDRYGLDLPAWMKGFEFAVSTDGAQPVVTVTSQRPVAEPFVTILLDIKWSSGRLLREYTVLLDPPLFEPAPVQPAVAPAEAAPEQSAAGSASAGTVARPAPVTTAPIAEPEPVPKPKALVEPLPPSEGSEPPPASPEDRFAHAILGLGGRKLKPPATAPSSAPRSPPSPSAGAP